MSAVFGTWTLNMPNFETDQNFDKSCYTDSEGIGMYIKIEVCRLEQFSRFKD